MSLHTEVVKRSVSAHSAMGLTVGVLMYLICLTGALAALAETFERWEQPGVEEFLAVQPAAISNAMSQFRAQLDSAPDSLWVVFPTPELPRMHVTDGERERFTREDGSLDVAPVENWTHMLRELHVQLHLPQTIGLTLVSALGAILIGLIVSGLLAHPRLFKDAFQLRLGGSRRLEQTDIHNRLSVWALPFHLMIAITGAFYGLVGLLAYSAALGWYDGDTNAVFDAVYGSDPVLTEQVGSLDAAEAMRQLKVRHPDVSPIYLVAHKLDTDAQFMEIAATVPGRLAYSEIYRFNAQGNYLGSQQLTTGPAGRQLLYSMYRIHFGYFGGQGTRVLWWLLGMMLTVVSVTGINIWLAKRNLNDGIDHAWLGFVWGAPLALTASALSSVLGTMPPLPIFLATLLASVLFCVRTNNLALSRQHLLLANGLALLLLALGHWALYTPHVYGAYFYWVNGSLVFLGLVFVSLGQLFRVRVTSVRSHTAH